MKRKYEKPNMDLEMFEANEYIAACKCVGGGKYSLYNIYKEGNFLPIGDVHENRCRQEKPQNITTKGYINYDGDKISGYYWNVQKSMEESEVDKEGKLFLKDLHFANHS